MIKVTLKDDVVKEYNEGISILEIAKDISEGLARNACCGIVNGEVEDLRYAVNEDAKVLLILPKERELSATQHHT